MTLTEQIRDRARALRREGLSVRAIGKLVDASYQLVQQVVWDMTPPERRRKLVPPMAVLHPNCWQCGAAKQPARGRFCGECNFARSHFSGRSVASAIVAKAIRSGDLPHPRGLVCVDCAGEAVEYDHRDYSLPLVVQPVCRKCNARRGSGKWTQFKTVRELTAERRGAAHG